MNFICPVCSCDLKKEGRTFLCENRHSFDISKEGYVNLLMSQQSSLKRHGDDKVMVKARRDFLSGGFYDALRTAVCDCVNSVLPKGSAIADIGCGEGYYTSAVSEQCDCEIFGIDISKDALKFASKMLRDCYFAVASAFSLPFKDESADCILNVFAPSAYDEFSRILKNDGKLIKAVPLEDHLWELKSALYDKPYKNKPEKRDNELFKLISVKELKYKIKLDSKADIENLFKMTPYYYKTGRNEAQRLLSLDCLETTVHFGVEIYEKR